MIEHYSEDEIDRAVLQAYTLEKAEHAWSIVPMSDLSLHVALEFEAPCWLASHSLIPGLPTERAIKRKLIENLLKFARGSVPGYMLVDGKVKRGDGSEF